MKCLHFGADSSAAKSEPIFIKIPVSVTDSLYFYFLLILLSTSIRPSVVKFLNF